MSTSLRVELIDNFKSCENLASSVACSTEKQAMESWAGPGNEASENPLEASVMGMHSTRTR